MVPTVLIYGAVGGLLIAALKLGEYHFLVVEHSIEIYGALVAAIFAGLGIWLGQTLTRNNNKGANPEIQTAQAEGIPAAPAATTPFVASAERVQAIGLTPRELEILGLIASGLSNREIAATLFVSENTVKTHSSRLFDKLGARRRTQAVQIGQAEGLIP
jgi:ATP/maltotriose-dependent transcriptional regulator MalT